jgi:hypothetical protein
MMYCMEVHVKRRNSSVAPHAALENLRAGFLHAAFAVASLADAEARLKHFGIEFHKFLVPGTNASQIFLYDPEGE